MTTENKLTKEEANKALSEAVAKFNAALNEAEAIADEYGLCFHIDPAYGMGGTYEGQGDKPDEDNEYTGESVYGWHPSSTSC